MTKAIFAPQYNTYYFYSPVTQETTWTHFKQPQPGQHTSTSPPPQILPPLPQIAHHLRQEIQFPDWSIYTRLRQPGHL